jgi:hypothetical protein
MNRTVLLLTLIFASEASADTVEISPSGDTSISQAQRGRNFGSSPTLSIRAATSDEYRSLLRFDIGASVPPGSIITAASLKLEPSGEDRDMAFSATLHRINQYWNEGRGTAVAVVPVEPHETTWSHRVHVNGRWVRAGGARGIDFSGRPSAAFELPTSGAVFVPSTARLVRDVQSWLDRPYSNEGWMLVANSGGARYCSREDASRRPLLKVEFTPPGDDADSSRAEYEIVFRATWSATTHPRRFPANAHWSGIVGGFHNHVASFWRRGSTATEGIRRMAELGSQSILLSEVNAAIAQGTASQGLSGSGIAAGTGLTTLRLSVDRSHPLATVTSMVAPSPDWFVGVRNLPLIERGRWVRRKSVTLFPYDAGTDSGKTFSSENLVTNPRGVISRIITPPLANSRGYVRPMGVMTFRRVDAVPR